jgi:phospholipase C
MAVSLPDPGTYDLSIHGPNGFFRHFAGSPLTSLAVSVATDVRRGTVTLRVVDQGHRRGTRTPVVVMVTDAYGSDQKLELSGGEAGVTVATAASGGWYDVALTTPSDATFAHALAGRLESGDLSLTSDPQLGAEA